MKSYFFNAVKTSDTTTHPSGYDREYDADDHAAFFAPFFSEAGVFAGADAGACKVQVQSGLTLVVSAGAVYVRGRMAVFDGTETVTVSQNCKIVARMDKSMAVRDFQLLAVTELTQTEDVYDLELASVTLEAVSGGHEVHVTDTRTFLSYMGQPAYYPPTSDDLPYILWLYTLGFPMSEEQRAAVEGNPSLMSIFEASVGGDYAGHKSDKQNPHEVTAAQAGAYTKEETLSEDTKTLLGLSGTATPDDAFVATLPKIGDIKITVRTDLGDNWLLCNGEAISEEDYPELYAIAKGFGLTPSTRGVWTGTSSYNSWINSIAYGNGYYVAVGKYYDGSSSCTARIAYTTSLSGTWTTKDLWKASSSSLSGQCEINCVGYGNGYWVVGGAYCDGSYTYGRIAYATSPNGTWTTKDLWKGYNTAYTSLRCITYVNGYWIAGGNKYVSSSPYNYAQIAYATSPNGTWTTKDLWSGSSYDTVRSIAYGNGYYVVGGTGGDHYGRIAYATSLSGTWTTKDLWGSTNYNNNNHIYSVAYGNGYWVVGGAYYDGSRCYAQIAYATSPNGIWTTQDLWAGNSDYALRGVIYANSTWIAVGRGSSGSGQIAYTTSLSGTWTTKTLSSLVPLGVVYANGYLLIPGKDDYVAVLGYSPESGLPEIDLPNAYAYIKALE